MKRLGFGLLTLAVICLSVHTTAAEKPAVISGSGVQGGLVVIVGCDDTAAITAFAPHKPFLVQALDTDAAKIERVRQAIQDGGNYGRLSAVLFDGKTLPYADNLVNLIVVSGTNAELSADEINRVLTPGGVSLVNGKKSTKPVPDSIDEWTHYLYDAKNNAVSNDAQVETPKSLQWDSGPRWSRHHDHMSSVSAVVSSGGRVFSIMDEGPQASIQYPADWQLTARDAFNGTLLWKRAIPHWHTRIWPAKAGPAQLPRRLVAVGDKVFVTLGLHAPVTMLDAATGETLKIFEATEHTEEIIVSGNELFVVAHAEDPPEERWQLQTVRCWTEARRSNQTRPWKWDISDPKKIIAIDIPSSKLLWSKESAVAKITLGVDDRRAIYHNGENVVCLDRKSGNELWTSKYTASAAPLVKESPNLVIYGDVVLYSPGPSEVASLSIEDGKTLWIDSHGSTGHQSTYDLLVAGGLVWSTSGGRVRPGSENFEQSLKFSKKPRWTYIGRDPLSGEVMKVFPPGKSDWFHHRCHRGRGTQRFLIMARTGIEYVDIGTGRWQPNPWVRGACLYGYMPANGLTYAPPHPCARYIESKLNGFNALVGAGAAGKQSAAKPGPRLETGPAYKKVTALSPESDSGAWPTYRSDNMRSGASKTEVPADLKKGWSTKLGGKLSPVTVANGKVFVAAVDKHTIYALDAKTGEVAWEYTAGGRVDTPPTIAGELCIFGSRDGWIYCLAAADGRLAWRYRAVAQQRTIVSYDQLELTWPVSGAVLVMDGSLYCVAGRSMFLDGGLHLVRLDATTGELLFEEIMDDTIPNSGEPLDTTARGLDMPVALADILSSDGKRLYMRSQSIGLDGKRTDLLASGPTDQDGPEAHLVCSSGYLDDAWFHRAYWVFGHGYGTGHNGWFRAGRFAPAGRMLVFDKDSVFGYGRKPNMYVWSSALEYQLFAARRDVQREAIERVIAANRKQESRGADGHGHEITFDRKLYGSYPLNKISAIDFNWRKENPPLQARAMALAGKTLFVAGPPDVVDEEEIFSKPFNDQVTARAKEQVAALRGSQGSLLYVVSSADGKKLNELKFDGCPVFDGMAAAGGKLFISMMDGTVVCCE